ncbi:MAG TPA: TerB family tellurite resistance protein [Crocinitomix sp.]|nr:TerB family tellurite resistance protein [Crocinitomix sp.]
MSIAKYFESGERQQDLGHFRNLVLIANVDGHLDERELGLLFKIGHHIGLTNTQIGEIMDHPKDYAVIPPISKDERMEMIIDMIRMMVSDGKIVEGEEKLIERYAVKLGYKSIDDVDVESIIALIERGEDNDTIITELN